MLTIENINVDTIVYVLVVDYVHFGAAKFQQTQYRYSSLCLISTLICLVYAHRMKPIDTFQFTSSFHSDLSELPKPTTSNADVVRFFRYVQAARDGQDQRDCLQIYGQCTINTEK